MAVCSIAGCGKKTEARGWCKMHYSRWRRHGDPNVTNFIRLNGAQCTVEGCERKGVKRGWCSAHYKHWRTHGDVGAPLKRVPSWKGVRCKAPGCELDARSRGLCPTHYQQYKWEHSPEMYEVALEQKRTYTRERVEKLMGRPRPEVCEVCEQPDNKKNIAFDHCHETGKPRGWLCGRCNRTLGWVNDDPVILRKLAAYLDAHAVK